MSDFFTLINFIDLLFIELINIGICNIRLLKYLSYSRCIYKIIVVFPLLIAYVKLDTLGKCNYLTPTKSCKNCY